ncbi:transposase [Streptomyces turgidiscabies]|uniref:transposase n=1 Tax=Streptomyces turgidiscabies TaxID=85558 RepID=UPI00358FE69B
MSNKQGKRYSEECKRDAVALARSTGKTVTEVARDLGVSPEGLRSWVKQDKADRGEPGGGGPRHGLDLPCGRHREVAHEDHVPR